MPNIQSMLSIMDTSDTTKHKPYLRQTNARSQRQTVIINQHLDETTHQSGISIRGKNHTHTKCAQIDKQICQPYRVCYQLWIQVVLQSISHTQGKQMHSWVETYPQECALETNSATYTYTRE